MRGYTPPAQEERYQIYALLKAGHCQTENARILGRSKSTISRELSRTEDCGAIGHDRPICWRWRDVPPSTAFASRRQPGSELSAGCEKTGARSRSACGCHQEEGIYISHEWIYWHILRDKQAGGDLYRHLRCQKTRRKRYGSYDRRGQIPNRVTIDERPTVVESQRRIGDWKVDTIIGKGRWGALVSLTERKSRLTWLAKVAKKTAQAVRRAILEQLAPLADQVLTLTAGNGKEFAQHDAIAQALDAAFYFAHPYASWQRGTNENANGLVRQYFPKDRDFSTITDEEIQTVMDKLNNRPRKCLGMEPPIRCFSVPIHPLH